VADARAPVATGLERVLAGEVAALRGKRLGLLANPTAVDRGYRHAIDGLRAVGLDLVALFGPEHGLRGDAQYMVAIDEVRDARSGLPIHSLYGHDAASLSPRPAWLAGLDALVFDIQDVGSRYYTYVWTLVLCMRVAAEADVEVIVLDRPNPIGGELVEGGAIAPGFESFVGLMSLPNRHGLTAGELAAWANAQAARPCRLTVIECAGWRRGLHHDETTAPWVMPSPNMPTVDTALVYPGMCLLEGTEVSEGRGTTRPFELVGAPWVDGHALADALAADGLPGVGFRPATFTPTWNKHAGEACGGVQLHVTDRAAFRPYLTGVAILRALRALDPAAFRWRVDAYEFVADRPAIDLLAGSPALRLGLERGDGLAALAATWAAEEAAFVAARGRFLRYP
jgi:uncharacterized protein YbbC (DUF1343 family)